MSHPPDPRSARRAALVCAELGLLALALGTAAGFVRLFEGWSWLGRLAVPMLAAWATAAVTRRSGLGIGRALPVQGLVALLVLSWTFAPGTLAVVLPTPATVSDLASQVSASFASFSELVAPVPATTGFLVVIAAAMWVIVSFSDIAALRFRAPVQATVPNVATFAAVGILARSSGRTTAALCFAGGLVLYAAGQRFLAGFDRRWVGGRALQGSRAVVVSGLAVGTLAVLAGAALGPRLPGGTDPVVDLRDLGRGSGPRTVVSPFVGIRSLLGERSDDVMFTVAADRPAYWRLTSLEEYDVEREIWVSRGSYQRTDGELPRSVPPEVAGEPFRQQVEIAALSSLWLPAAYVPSSVDSEVPLSYDARSSSLILRDEQPSGAIGYTLDSLLPDFSSIVTSTGGAGDDLDPSYTAVPDLEPAIVGQLDDITAAATTPYEQMLALQNWFRSDFTYDEEVDYAQSADPIADFLEQRRGFCQQFASTFALFARSLGIPSRVAVGFTPGDPVLPSGEEESAAGVQFVVRGRHAHAWPEVYFAGSGWVPFEPTPQRGNPQAEQYTGVPAAQADAPPEQAATTTSTSILEPTTTAAPGAVDGQVDAVGPQDQERATSGDGRGPATVAGLAAAVLVIAAVLTVLVRRRRARAGSTRGSHDAVVAGAWSDAVRALALVDLRPVGSETPIEFARRADGRLPEPLLAELALLETQRRFGADPLSAEQCTEARRAADRIVEHSQLVTTRRQRVGAMVGR